MDQDAFVKAYFGALAQKMSGFGYDPEKLIATVWKGTGAMVKNDGSCSNEDAFWRVFCDYFGQESIKDIPAFEEFYHNEFQKVQQVCGYAPEAAQIVHMLKQKGIRVVLATNPIFPAVATQSRIRWAGLEPEDFAYYTTYENSSYCKPNPAYYRQICEKLGLDPTQCLMVGNDALEDMAAQQLGMDTFLLTPCLLNRDNRDISGYRQGDFSQLEDYLNTILETKHPA